MEGTDQGQSAMKTREIRRHHATNLNFLPFLEHKLSLLTTCLERGLKKTILALQNMLWLPKNSEQGQQFERQYGRHIGMPVHFSQERSQRLLRTFFLPTLHESQISSLESCGHLYHMLFARTRLFRLQILCFASHLPKFCRATTNACKKAARTYVLY